MRPVGARTLVSLAKLSMAVARFRMKTEVGIDDVDYAYKIYYEASVSPMLRDYGSLDYFSVVPKEHDVPVKRPDNKKQMYEWVLHEIERTEDKIITFDELLKKISDFGLSETALDMTLDKLKNTGAIFEPRPNEFKKL